MKRKSIISISLFLLLMLGLGRKHLWDAANKSAGYLLASYGLYTNHPKLYIYGNVRVADLKEKYNKLGIEPVFRGCLVGDNRYVREMSYNNIVNNSLAKLRIIKLNK